MLVANTDGVFHVDADGDVSRLVSGRAVYAVDDTRGGLLFQRQRGRDWEEEAAWDATVVWWIPAGATTPRELLVPTPGSGHELSLHDAFATEDGFAVLYTRHESDHPVDGRVDSLRRYDYPNATVTELYSQGAWEQGYGGISTNGDLISGVTYGQVSSGCFILDIRGDATDLVPVAANDPSREDQIEGCALTPEGDILAFTRVLQEPLSAEVRLWKIGSGEVSRFSVPISGRWGPGDLDIGDGQVLLNRQWEGMYEPALVLDINQPDAEVVELPVPGLARFVTAPVDIPDLRGDVDYYRYGEDGLFRIFDGVEEMLIEEPVWDAWDDYRGGVVFTTSPDRLEVFHMGPDQNEPARIEWGSGYGYPRFTGLLAGRPVLFFAGVPEDVDRDNWPCEGWALNSRDLLAGDERFHICLPIEDADLGVASVGEGVFVGAPSVMSGSCDTSTEIRFWDIGGRLINEEHNPISETCQPCEVTALISMDGEFIAYSHRPDAKWPPDEWDGVPFERWWEQTSQIPREFVVMNLNSGDIVWRIETAPEFDLSDFDGRFLVTERRYRSANSSHATIYDTWDLTTPVQVSGQVTLMRSGNELLTMRDDGLGVVSFGQMVDEAMAVLTELLGPPDWTEVQIDVETDFSVGWNDPHLYLQFTYWDYFDAAPEPPGPMPEGLVFHYYLTQSDELATEKGIAVGSSVAALKESYPGVRFFRECDARQWSFSIDASSEWPSFPIFGLLDGDPDDPTTRIVHIGAGWDRTPC